MDRSVPPDDERRHPPGPEMLWGESWYFDFAATDGSVGGYVRVGLYPNLDRVWYWATLVGRDRDPVLVIDHEVPLPRGVGSLELRSSGLWADNTCETALDHWSLGLEAFGVRLDDPADAYGSMRGDRVPIGFDLEWETNGVPFLWPVEAQRYEIPCRVHGEILCGDETIEVDAIGQRDHSWGVRDWWVMGWCWFAGQLDDGTQFHATRIKDFEYAAGYVQRDGSLVEVTECEVEERPGPDGIPLGAHLSTGGLELDVEPLAWAPVGLVADDGRVSRFPRGMCRFTDSERGGGIGWIEFNQPQP
jgi:hypothetical protein